jgi:hypothetical protein
MSKTTDIKENERKTSGKQGTRSPPTSKRKTIASWRLNARGERVRVRLDKYGGLDRIDVRAWYRAKGGELKPTRRGISLAVRELPKFARAVRRACRVARKRGLIK